MRKILFRGKRKDNGNWIYGTVVYPRSIKNENYVAIVPIVDGISVYSMIREVIPETVGQFTGIYDKNCQEIFEGDICTYPDGWVDHAGDGVETFSVGVVTWDDKNPSFYLTNNIGVEWDEIWGSVDEITVIGNVHDDPCQQLPWDDVPNTDF